MPPTKHEACRPPRARTITAAASAALLFTLACDPVEDGADAELELDEEELDDFTEEVPEEDDAHVPPTSVDEIEAPTDPAAAVTGTWDYAIISVVSGKCLTASGTGVSSEIRQENCVFDSRQRFDKIDGFRWRNVGTNLCIDSVFGSLSQQWCGPWSEQKFYEVGDGTGSQIKYIREYDRYRCWDVPSWTTGSSFLQSFPCHGGLNQDWMVVLVY